MSSRAEKERDKQQQEKFQAVLSGLLKDDDNKYCVDCDAKGPRWASWNLGIFLCIRCAGIHRNLGVHISKVKSVNLDAWTAEQVAMVMEIGNSRARAIYEANIPDGFRRPQSDSRSLEAFIRAKYEQKKYIAREWVPPKPTIPKELKSDQKLELEDKADKRKARAKQSGIQLSSVPKSKQVSSGNKENSSSSPKKAEENKPPPAANNSDDLLGLELSPTKTKGNVPDLLGDLNDFMSSPSQPSVITNGQQNSSPDSSSQQQNGSIEANLFEDPNPSEKAPEKSTKDSIMALFAPSSSQPQQQQQQFGVPAGTSYYFGSSDLGMTYETGGLYMPSTGMAAPGMYNMGVSTMPVQSGNMMYQQQQQQQQQQPMMAMQQTQQQPVGMYNMMGMPQGPAAMAMSQGSMTMPTSMAPAMPQGNMVPGRSHGTMATGMQQGNMGMYNQQQMQYQQMQQQMAGMRISGGNMMATQPNAGALNWNPSANSGHTLSTNLWQ